MTRDKLIDCLKGKEGKPISIHYTGGIIMGIFERIEWDTDGFTIRGIKIDTREDLFKPDDIIEINDAPRYTDALKIMRMMNESQPDEEPTSS